VAAFEGSWVAMLELVRRILLQTSMMQVQNQRLMRLQPHLPMTEETTQNSSARRRNWA
jgi:hypothetical protein